LLYLQPALARTVRLRRALIALAALCVLLATPALAQDQDQDQGQGTGSGTPSDVDTTSSQTDDGSILGHLGIRPLYTSQVEINRSAFRWDQSVKMDRNVHRLKLQDSWTVGIQKNSAQNHFKSRAGNSQARGEYLIPALGGWSTGADLGLKRVFSGGDFNRTVDDGNDFSWFLTSGALGSGLSKLFRAPEGALSWDITGSAGATQSVDIRENRTQAVVGGRSDSTHATGSTSQIDTRLAAELGKEWKLDVSGRIDRDSEDSVTRQRAYKTATELTDSALVAQNRNHGKRIAFNAGWSPNPRNRIGMTGQFSRAVNQSYSADVRQQDTKTGLDQRFTLDAKLVPFWGINLDLKAENNITDISYAISRQGRGRTRKAGSGRLNFIVGSAMPLLGGTEMTTEVNWEKSRNTFLTSANYDNDITNLRQVVRRPLGRRVVLVSTGEASLNRMFYADGKQDKDDLRYMLDGALGYRPAEAFDCRLTAQWRRQETVYIPAANSRNSVTGQSYQMGAEIGLQVTPLIKINQKYAMTADYSFYNFNEISNSLSRTTEVRTGLQSTVGSKAKLNLDHLFRFKDAGKYVRDNPGAPRLYSLATKETYQFLVLTTRYDFTSEFSLRASQRLEVRETRQRNVETPVRTEKLEFTGGMDLNHNFSKDFSVNARMERTQSSSEKSYVRVSGSVNRTF
jgi:hypothetical protein